jgi:hypothetical protein
MFSMACEKVTKKVKKSENKRLHLVRTMILSNYDKERKKDVYKITNRITGLHRSKERRR